MRSARRHAVPCGMPGHHHVGADPQLEERRRGTGRLEPPQGRDVRAVVPGSEVVDRGRGQQLQPAFVLPLHRVVAGAEAGDDHVGGWGGVDAGLQPLAGAVREPPGAHLVEHGGELGVVPLPEDAGEQHHGQIQLPPRGAQEGEVVDGLPALPDGGQLGEITEQQHLDASERAAGFVAAGARDGVQFAQRLPGEHADLGGGRRPPSKANRRPERPRRGSRSPANGARSTAAGARWSLRGPASPRPSPYRKSCGRCSRRRSRPPAPWRR